MLVNTIHGVEPADEPPAAGSTRSRQVRFVSAFLQRQVYGGVFSIHDAKKSGVPEALRASAPVKDSIVQKQADVIAISDVEFFDLVLIGGYCCARVNELHPFLWLESF
jgi:hypothetical protein